MRFEHHTISKYDEERQEINLRFYQTKKSEKRKRCKSMMIMDESKDDVTRLAVHFYFN